MITLNVHAVSSLSHRFGKDMKERRRGRIMIVSSLSSMAVGIKSVAVYSATKAFERATKELISFDQEMLLHDNPEKKPAKLKSLTAKRLI